MRNWWRVTRYDPALRDDRGVYRGRTWISIAQVGESFDGRRLTLDEYVKTEDAYVDAVVAFAESSGVEVLEVRRPGSRSGLTEGEQLSIEAVRDLIRRLLREETWCQLESVAGDFAVHVGYDLYMFIGSDEPCESAVIATRDAGLFVDEDFISPFIPEDGE